MTHWARRPLGSSGVTGSRSSAINSSILLQSLWVFRVCACASLLCIRDPMWFPRLSRTAASPASLPLGPEPADPTRGKRQSSLSTDCGELFLSLLSRCKVTSSLSIGSKGSTRQLSLWRHLDVPSSPCSVHLLNFFGIFWFAFSFSPTPFWIFSFSEYVFYNWIRPVEVLVCSSNCGGFCPVSSARGSDTRTLPDTCDVSSSNFVSWEVF